jgi:hypothetical protein
MFGWLKKKEESSLAGPDFSGVNSPAKAEKLARRGELHKLYLTPPEFGGVDIPQNVVYVPAWVVEQKRNIDMNNVLPLVEQQEAILYAVTPQYEGKSLVPCAIKIVASGPSDFTAVINIWGQALNQS